MTVLFRCRVDPAKLERANKITSELGTSMAEVFRMFVSQIANTGKVPVSLEIQSGDALAGSWEERGKVLESFYDKSKTW